MAGGDLTSLEAVKAMMATGSTGGDEEINALIPRASRAITVHTRRQFAPLDASPSAREYPAATRLDSRTLLIDDLSAAPTLVEVLDNTGSTVATLDPATVEPLPVYRTSVDPVTSLLLRPPAPLPPSDGSVRVTGVWGFPAIPPDVEHAAILTVRAWMRADSNAYADLDVASPRLVGATPPGGWMLPQAARQLLRPYRRGWAT